MKRGENGSISVSIGSSDVGSCFSPAYTGHASVRYTIPTASRHGYDNW
jgi:hypothetical protein